MSSCGGDCTMRDAITVAFGRKSDRDSLLDIVETMPNEDIALHYGLATATHSRVFDQIK
jgi:hypothetical protein